MEEYGHIGTGEIPPRKQDANYGDGADDMRHKFNKARAGLGRWDKPGAVSRMLSGLRSLTPKFAEDPGEGEGAPALPTKAGADGMHEPEAWSAPQTRQWNSHRPAQEVASRREQSEIPETMFLHGALSRKDAEGLIKSAGLADGTFLVRLGWKGRGKTGGKGATFVLSLCKDSQFEHHVLSRNRASGMFEMNSKPLLRAQCSTLSEVVQHLSTDREGIATELATPVSVDAASFDDMFNSAPPVKPRPPAVTWDQLDAKRRERAVGRKKPERLPTMKIRRYGGESTLMHESPPSILARRA